MGITTRSESYPNFEVESVMIKNLCFIHCSLGRDSFHFSVQVHKRVKRMIVRYFVGVDSLGLPTSPFFVSRSNCQSK